jgi:hypothetical protein
MLQLAAATRLNCENSLHTIRGISGFVALKMILSTLSPSTVPDWTTHWFLADVSALGQVCACVRTVHMLGRRFEIPDRETGNIRQ